MNIKNTLKFLLATAALTSMLAGCQPGAKKINGTKIADDVNVAGAITNVSTGKGIKGIPVSDGFSIVLTDRHGVYQLKARHEARTIYYSTPAEYKLSQNEDGSPAFWAFRDTSSTYERHDFQLEKLPAVEDEFYILALADPQCKHVSDIERLNTESIPSIAKTADELAATGLPVYGVGLGDIAYDNLDLWPALAKSFRSVKTSYGHMPIFNVPGNHDHSNMTMTENDDYTALSNYINHFGPADYSFDRGQVHLIFMDDVVFTHRNTSKTSASYDAGFSADQMEWLKADLATVADKEEKMVIFCTHIPFRAGTKSSSQSSVNRDKNYNEVLSLLTEFKTARIMIGHTHYPQFYRHTEYITKSGLPVMEQIHGAVCGAWWYSNTCVDGTPMGYAVYKISGAGLEDFVPCYTDLGTDVQMRVYNGNDIYSGSIAKYAWEDDLKGCFIASVWYATPEDWKIEFVQNGEVTPMQFLPRGQRDWCTYSNFINERGRSPSNNSYATNRKHYWVIPAASGDPSRESNWEIRATYTVPESGKEHVFTCNHLQVGYEGL